MKLIPITLYTDGSCLKNGQETAAGGWAAILSCKGKECAISGNCATKPTNNRMELTAVIEGIKRLTKPCEVLVVTDSKYVCYCVENLKAMHDHGWATEKGNTPMNVDLLATMLGVVTSGQHELKFQYIKGHSGHSQNERCDKMAREQAMKVQVIA